MSAEDQAWDRAEPVADFNLPPGFEYDLLLIQSESIRARLDLAIKCGRLDLAAEIAPELAAVTAALEDARPFRYVN